MSQRFLTIMCGLGLLVALSFGAGCSSTVTADQVRRNPSPELHSIAHTKEQRKNMHARTFDTNKRQIPDDIDMMLLLDRPVRLSEYPIP